MTGREKVAAGWPGSHPGGPRAPRWRAGPSVGRALHSPPSGTWGVGRQGLHPPPGRSTGPPDQRRASPAAVTSCGCDVAYRRLSGCRRIVCGSLTSAGGCRGDFGCGFGSGPGGKVGGGKGGCGFGCGGGGRRKRSSEWAGPSSLLQGPGYSGCGRLWPWLEDIWGNFHKPARFHLGEARVHEGPATVRRFQGQGITGTWVSGVLGVAGARRPLPVFHTYFSD